MPQTPVERVDGLTTSVAVKAPCHCATTANITLAGIQTIDGILLTDEYPPVRVLVKNQTDETQNGIYNPHDGGRAWTRALDFDGQRDARNGTLVWVNSGDENVGLWKVVCDDDVVVIDTSEITFEPVVFGAASGIFQIDHERLGEEIPTGFAGDQTIRWAFEILGYRFTGNPSGSAVIDIWADDYVDETPPTDADSITASAPPTLSSERSESDFTLTGWTTEFPTDTWLVFNVDSLAALTYYKLTLICRRL